MSETPSTPDPATPQTAPTQSTEPQAVLLYRPTIIAMLYIANFMLGFSVLVGVVLAYVWRSEAKTQEWEKTHFTYHIRTFWMGLVVFLFTITGYFVMIFGTFAQQSMNPEPPPPWFFALFFGFFFVWLLAAAWFLIRCIMPLVRVGKQQPMPKPRTWLF